MKSIIFLLTTVILLLSSEIFAQNPAIKVSKISDSGAHVRYNSSRKFKTCVYIHVCQQGEMTAQPNF